MDWLCGFSERTVKKLSDRRNARGGGQSFVVPDRYQGTDIRFRFTLSQFPQECD